jgi:hypothetical protein
MHPPLLAELLNTELPSVKIGWANAPAPDATQRANAYDLSMSVVE